MYLKEVGAGPNTDKEWWTYVNKAPKPLGPQTLLPHAPYKKPEGAIIHAWRPGHWYTWMFELESVSADGNYTFGAGGNQGGEGNDGAGEWFIEGVEEELDAPNEFL